VDEAIHLGELLNLAPIGAVVRQFSVDTVVYWSQGAQELYGWSAQEVLGKVTHTLLQTQFPVSRRAVDDALRTTGHWSGELVHTHRDGHQIVVLSRQAVQLDAQGSPTFTLELNTDITAIKRLEATLRESEERFRLLVENVQDYAIYLLSPEGKVLSWNEGAQRLKGYAAEEILGESFERFYPPEAVAEGLPRRLLAESAANGRVEHEGWRIRKDGSLFWGDAVITALRDNRGELRGYAKITRDLTERRQAEEHRARASREEGARAAAEAAQAEISASRDQLAAILAGVADGIIAIAPGGQILYANAEAARLCGFPNVEEFVRSSPAEILRRFEIFDEDGAPFPLNRLPTRQSLIGERPPETLLRFRVRDSGQERWSLVTATPLKDEHGDVRMSVSIFRDVTERKRSEDTAEFLALLNLELTRSLDFDVIPQTLADLAVPTLADWCLVDIQEDQTATRLGVASISTDLPRSALPDAAELIAIGRPTLLSAISDADLRSLARDAAHLEAMRVLRLRSAISVPLVAGARAFGAITLLSAESQRHFTETDLAVAGDVAVRAALALDNARLYRESQQQTEAHVQLNAALRDVLTRLEQAMATRDEFLASASHDLKNPIASIKAMAQLLERRLNRTGVTPEQLRETLGRINAVATRASGQVDELLDLTRMRLDRPLDLDRDAIDVVALVGDVVAEYQQMTDRREFVFEPSVRSLEGRWDARRVIRALSNVLDNAIKYSPDNSTVRVRLHQAENGWAVIEIEDSGIGIPPDELETVFERFQRASNVFGHFAGTGIGLASAQHIVESHGGTIQASSELGVGTTITLQLPIEEKRP
jgi:PAS domain S-box-containing protein